MNIMKTLLFTTLALVASLSFAAAETYTKGVIKKLDTKAGKVTIIHEELIDLEMPAMTMVFRADEDIISKMVEGAEIVFLAGRVNGKLTVIALK